MASNQGEANMNLEMTLILMLLTFIVGMFTGVRLVK